MMKINKYVATGLLAGMLAIALSACQKQEGPVEKAGKAVDETMQKAGQKVEQAGEDIKDAAKDAKK